MTTNREELVIVELSDGFAVRDTSEEPAEYNHYGYLCMGCPSRADAERFIADYLAREIERERRWRDRAESEKDDLPPF